MKFRNRDWMRAEFAKALAKGADPVPSDVATDAATLATWTDAASVRAPVLFVGAGWSLNDASRDRNMGGLRNSAKRALTWAQLSDLLRKNLQPDVAQNESVDPLWLAELYRQRHGAEALHRAIEEAIPQSLQPGVLHRILFKVPWYSILTTNYDTLLEQALGPFGEFRSCVEDSDLVLSQSSSALEVIHLHGILSRPETIVLAYEDYRRYPTNHPGFLAKVRQLFLQHPVMFVGFGATDPNFLQWSGWLNDVVGEFKNPWISLTHNPPRGLALGRYWGTRLQFVALPDPGDPGKPNKAFDEVTNSIFRAIAGAFDEDTFDRSVVALRFLACTTVDAVFQVTRELLAVGDIRGYTGAEWEHSKQAILQHGASMLLELKGFPWRPAIEGDRNIMTIEIIVHNAAPGPQALLSDIERAIGADNWKSWLHLVREHISDSDWNFYRVRLDSGHSDRWNWVDVELRPRNDAAGTTSELFTTEIDDCKQKPLRPLKTPLDFRQAGFLAFEDGDWDKAANLYADAARLSREHGEPLRVRLLTLRSIRACLNGGGRYAVSDGTDPQGELLRVTNETIRDVEKSLRKLPRNEQLVHLDSRESDAHEKLSKDLLEEFLNPTGRPHSVSFGQPHSAAWDSFNYLKHNWFAQGVIHTAAKVLGLSLWFSGIRKESLEILFRYGSLLPKKLLESFAQRLNTEPGEMPTVLSIVLNFEGSFGEQLSRVESLGGLVPWLNADQFMLLRNELATLQNQLIASSGNLTRGTSRIPLWQVSETLDEVEQACWRWMPMPEAFEALDNWIRVRNVNAIASDHSGNGLAGLFNFDWKDILKCGIPLERVRNSVRVFLESAVASQRDGDPLENMPRVLWLLIQLWNDGLIQLTPGDELTHLFEQILDGVPEQEKAPLLAQKARLQNDGQLIDSCIEQALPECSNGRQLTNFSAMRVLAVLAEHCIERAPEVVMLVQRILDDLYEARLKAQGNPFASFENKEAELGPLMSALCAKWPNTAATHLIDCTRTLLDMYPVAAEHFTGIEAEKLGNLGPIVRRNVLILLQGGFEESIAPTRSQRFAGVRAIARAVSSKYCWLLDAEVALSLAILTESPSGALATYATWALTEWAAKGISIADAQTLALVVVPVLRRATRDRRLGVSVNGVRGLATVSEIRSDLVAGAELDEFRQDARIAMRRVFDKLVSTASFKRA